MVHVMDFDQAHFCLDRHVDVLICWICNENLHYIFCNAIGLCSCGHGNSVCTGYFHRRILYDKHRRSSLGLLSNNFSFCDVPVHLIWCKNRGIYHNRTS